ncbi:InlB B-repeat-containing protein [Paenibacillus sp. FSL R7-0313]|uniref:InlB B-repeat-containing protein n=1 Tax=Paenibacillus sp. FSL R7-0313 TaxID=2954532 RepID=UPI0030DC5A4D
MKVKKVRQGWKVSRQILMWMLVISLIVSAVPLLPAQSAVAAELPIQQTAVTKSSGFQDVSPTDWFHDAVVHVQEKGIFSGTNANSFSPKGTMTRAMYVTALGRMAGVDTGAYSTSSFADVQAGSWYAPYVEWAVKEGITDGTGGGKYSPNATVSREQMATMTLRYFESEQIPYQTENPVTTEPGDLGDVSPWAADAVIKLWQAGVFTGDEKGNFNPRAQATRAEAAVLFMRNNAVVEAWKNQNQTPVTPTPTPTPTPTVTPTPTPSAGGNSGGGTSGGSGGGNTGEATYTLTFESNGGTPVDAQKVRKGQALNNLPAPTKEGYIFQGWFADSDLSLIFASGSTLNADTKLYAKYTDSIDRAVQSVPSYSVLDVAPNFTIKVQDSSGSLTESQVKEGMTFVDTANPEFEGVTVSGGNGVFTVASAAEDGKFVEGNTYQLELTNDKLSFQGQDETTSIYVFSVAKQEVIDIPLNPDMIYLPFTDVTDMILNGEAVGSPSIPVVSTTVGGSENVLAEANASSGTFVYSGNTVIQVGDTVAIYQGVRPDLRTLETTGADDGDVAYVQITEVDGSTYTYDHADTKQVLLKPDVLPVSVQADTDGDPNNNSITVEHTQMNYSDSLYEPFGLDELTTVDVGDFIGFYEGNFAEEGSRVVSYGRITSITPAAEMDVITYTDASIEDIENVFNIYQKQAIDGEDLLSEEQIAELEEQIEQQAIASGFVNQAADYLSDLALETKDIRDLKEIQQIKAQSSLASGKSSRVSVENLTVVASLGTILKNINGRSSGVSATLQVGADIVVNINEDSDMVIHMTSTFVQEMSLDLGINGDIQGHWLKKWGIPYWYSIDDYVITANLDAYSYTGLNITAEMALIEHDKLQAALNNWAGEKKAGRLGQVQDIATQIKASMDGVQDTSIDTDELKEQYQEMLEKDTEWIPLIKKELFEKSVRVAYGIVEVKFEAEFVVSAQVNLTIGADFYYKMAKRYSVTLRVLSFSGSSNTVSLPGDGDYQFTFYVMGTLGLRAGIHMEVKAGLGSVKLNSIGLAVEPGVYVNLWGYFYYQLKNVSGVKTTKSLGALFVEIGIYLEVAVGAQLGDGALSAGKELVDKEWPLYTIGEPDNVYDFAYPQDESLEFTLAGSASSIAVPELWLTMSTFDLTTGDTDTEAYDLSRFDIQVDNPNFKVNEADGKIEVVDTSRPVSKGSLVITWKGAPLSFTSDPLKRTIPLTWRVTAGEYIFQLHPGNGGVTQVLPFVYNAAVNVPTPVYPGYTFDGWYTAATGGTKVTIPSRMPKDDYELYAHWKVNHNTPYTVEHYLIDPDTRKATSASPAYTELLTGTTDTEIRINSDRFKSQGYANGESVGRIIKGNGSTVVRIEYYPASHTVAFNLGYPGAPRSTITEPAGRNIAGRIPTPTRTGYTFAGWSPEVPGTMPTSDTEYTAIWSAKEDTPYQVVYLKQNMASDTYTVADTETYRGATDTEANLTNITPRSYAGFKFDENVPGTVLTSQITGNGKTVLKLYYKRDAHTLTVDYNGSGQATKVIEVPFGATTQLYLGTPIWQGHVFAGWSPTPPTTMPEESMTFTAHWTTNAYTVKFNSNGGAEEVENQTVGYGNLVSTPIEPTNEGYVFGGWYTSSDLTTLYNFTAPVTGDLTLYAKWLLRYTVSFESNEGSVVTSQTVNEGSKAEAPVAPEREGYVFSGWYSDIELITPYDFTTAVVTTDLTLYAKWTVYVPNTYTVTFESNGGSIVDAKTVNEGAVASAPGVPIREGYTFSGWYSDIDLTTAYGFTAGVMENIMLYAKWTRNSYTVSFSSNGGSLVSSQSVSDGDTATEPAAPIREGYVFGGWYSDIGLNEAYDFTTSVTASHTLYAKWTVTYTVTFESNEGSSVDAQTVEYDGQAIAPAVPTKDGYIFSGWYSDAGLNEAYSFTTPVTDNLTLYAKWTSDKLTVSFDSNGGSAVDDQVVSPGGHATAPTAPMWEGYVFAGWYSDLEGTIAYDFQTAVTSSLTLYAKWTVTPWLNVATLPRASGTYQILTDSQGAIYASYNKHDAYQGGLGGYSYVDHLYMDKYEGGEWKNIYQGTEKNWLTRFALDNQDTLYQTSSSGEGVYLQRYNGSSWEDIARNGSLPGEGSDIAFDHNNVPYLVYNNSDNKMQVVKYEGNQWVAVAGGEDLGEKTGSAVIQFDQNNIPYVLNAVQTNASILDVAVLKYINGAWERIGDFGRVDVEPGSGIYVKMELNSNGMPYVLYSAPSTAASPWVLMRYNGTDWEKVGEFNSSMRRNSYMGLFIDKYDIPYVAYEDSANGQRATIMKYEGEWVAVDKPGFSSTEVHDIQITKGKDGNLYVMYKEGVAKVNQLSPNFTKIYILKHKIE